jgi:hypothetical protein
MWDDYLPIYFLGCFIAFIIVLIVVVVPLLVMSARTLNRIENRLRKLETERKDGEHDTLNPVFSALQVRLARQRFTDAYRGRLRLEQLLDESPAWLSRAQGSAPSEELSQQMRKVCEALVESECAWKEYVFMIDGNVRVAHRGEQGRQIVTEWEALLESTRGVPVRNFVAPNVGKLERVDAWLNNWIARLMEPARTVVSDVMSGGNTKLLEDELFREVWEDREEWRRPFQ